MALESSNLLEVGLNLSGNASSTPAPAGLPPIFGVEISLTANSTADAEISSQGLSEFITTLVLNAIIGSVLMVLFEIKRNKKSVYAPRLSKLPHRASPPLPYGPLRWIWTVATLSGPETLRLAGMDAYCLVRFIYLCFKICLFASFWGMAVLTPIYAYGQGGATGIYYITLANVAQSSSKLWAALVFAYLFTLHALYVLRGEHQVFAEMREEYLTRGDPDFSPQTLYTTKVENVPNELRSAVALEAYFDDLFPDHVHSAVMCLDMRGLEDKVEKREIIADKLEKTRSLQLRTGKRIMHRNRRFWCDCWGGSSGLTEADYLVGELEKLNEEIKKEQKAFLRAAKQLNDMDDRLIHKTSSILQGSTEQGMEGTGDYGTSSSGEPMERLEVLMRAKADMESRWAMEEEDMEESGSPAYRAGSTDQEVGQGSSTADREESQARRRRATRESDLSARPSPYPGDSSAMDTSQTLGAGLIDNPLAKDALSSLTFVGNTALQTTRKMARGVLYLTLGEKMSNTGFVTFRQMSACAASRQVLLAPRPDWCDCEPAPDPRDVVWSNIAVPKNVVSHLRKLYANASNPPNEFSAVIRSISFAALKGEIRTYMAFIMVAIGAIFWSIPVAAIQFWASFSELEKIFPWLSGLDVDSIWYSLISGYLPVVLLLLLMMVLPFLFQILSYQYERRKSHSEIQRSVLTRYFLYQVANIYITVASGSIFSALTEIFNNPVSLLSILGDTFPAVAVYFLDVIVVKALAGLPFELLRGWPLIRVLWSQKCTNRAYATEREIRTGPFGPAQLLYGWVYPTLLLVLVVCFIYAVISPFIMPAGGIFFAFAYLIYKHQVLYVYVPKYESGGVFWFSVYPRVLIGLGLAQLTLAGYVYIREGYYQGSLMLPLPVIIYVYGYRSFKRYLGPAERISMETAARIDRRGAAATAAAVKRAAEGRRGRRWQGGSDLDESKSGSGTDAADAGEDEQGVNPDDFEPLLYAQLALTSPSIEQEDCSPSKTAILAAQYNHGKCAPTAIASEETQHPSQNADVAKLHATEPSTATSAELEATGTVAEPVETERRFTPAFCSKSSVDTGDAGLMRRELEGMRRRSIALSSLTSTFYLARRAGNEEGTDLP